MNRIGKFIVLEGIDQSGKKTQVNYLAATLSSKGYKSRIISFPIYTTAVGREIEKSLSGKVDYPVEVRHLVLSANRWEMRSQIEESLLLDIFLICNRYTHLLKQAVRVAGGCVQVIWSQSRGRGIFGVFCGGIIGVRE